MSSGRAVLSKVDQKSTCITFETRKNQSYFPAGLFGDFGKYSLNQFGSPTLDAPLPGIPLDPFIMENRMKVRCTKLEVKFSTPAGEFL